MLNETLFCFSIHLTSAIDLVSWEAFEKDADPHKHANRGEKFLLQGLRTYKAMVWDDDLKQNLQN